MALLNKKYNFIWYGFCPGTQSLSSCTNFPLDSHKSDINTVWQIDDSGSAKSWIAAASSSQSFSELDTSFNGPSRGMNASIHVRSAEIVTMKPHEEILSAPCTHPAFLKLSVDICCHVRRKHI